MVDVPFFRFAVSLTAASYRPESGDESRRFHSPKRRRSPNLPVDVTIWDKEEPLINMFGDKKLHYPQGESCWEEDKHMFRTESLQHYEDGARDVHGLCDDDWNLAQNLIVNRCDPFAYKPVLNKSFLMIET
ncbi:BnaAnng02610D [Brassica napus]|uniref:BnaAnng02610D protein n=1 Tax=Brassica napus TaxID=3708 RepID=A0A078G0G8_BRANA|nr:BnaAnng02610D [Brassica napus]